jgi:hypothetical protein
VTTHEKDRGARGIRIAGEHQQLTLPGMLWSAGRDRARSAPLFFEAISKEQANELIASFGHPLEDDNRSVAALLQDHRYLMQANAKHEGETPP